MKNGHLQTLGTVAIGTIAGLWVLENLFHFDIAHQAGKAKAPAAGAGGGKAAKGATPAAAPAAAAPDATAAGGAGGGTWGQNPASKTPCDIPGKPCPTVGALGSTGNWCKCLAAGGGTAAAPAPTAATGFTCTTCTAGATPGSFTCTNCSGAGAPASVTATPAATTPAASAASVAYAYAGWAIAR